MRARFIPLQHPLPTDSGGIPWSELSFLAALPPRMGLGNQTTQDTQGWQWACFWGLPSAGGRKLHFYFWNKCAKQTCLLSFGFPVPVALLPDLDGPSFLFKLSSASLFGNKS